MGNFGSESANSMAALIEKTWPKWKVRRMLGEGSYGCVFEAYRSDIGGNYGAAIKVIGIPKSDKEFYATMQEGMDEVSATSYFKNIVEVMVREFALMDKLKGNTNIVAYEDHEVIARENGLGWDILIRMELLTPLSDYNMRHPLDEKDVIKLGMDISRALDVCEKYNIVHRDIKPENVFVSELGDFKLGDFGVARTAEQATSGMSVRGTYAYMAPEVYKSQEYNLTVDIYSLGVMIYRLMNYNRAPFVPLPPNPISLSDKERSDNLRINGTPFPPAANASFELMKVINRATAFNPKERYQHAEEMWRDLMSIVDGEKITASMDSEQLDISVKNAGASMNFVAQPTAMEAALIHSNSSIQMEAAEKVVKKGTQVENSLLWKEKRSLGKTEKQEGGIKTVESKKKTRNKICKGKKDNGFQNEGIGRLLFSLFSLVLILSYDVYVNIYAYPNEVAMTINAFYFIFVFLALRMTPFVVSWNSDFDCKVKNNEALYGRLFLRGIVLSAIVSIFCFVLSLINGNDVYFRVMNIVASEHACKLVFFFIIMFFSQQLWIEGFHKSAVIPMVLLGILNFLTCGISLREFMEQGHLEVYYMGATVLVYFLLAYFQMPGYITRYYIYKPKILAESQKLVPTNWSNLYIYLYIVLLFGIAVIVGDSRSVLCVNYVFLSFGVLIYWFFKEWTCQLKNKIITNRKYIIVSVIAMIATCFIMYISLVLSTMYMYLSNADEIMIKRMSLVFTVPTLLTVILINKGYPKWFGIINFIVICFMTLRVDLHIAILGVAPIIWVVVMVICFMMLREKKDISRMNSINEE